MIRYSGFVKKTGILCSAALFFVSGLTAAPAPVLQRLDLYDAADNHLMYMTFTYTQDGRNVGRVIYMADGTFMRNVVISYDETGHRLNEISYDFNGDVVYKTNYLPAENGSGFNILDQFNSDIVGDRVVYTNNDPLNFTLAYTNAAESAAAVRYTKDAATGQLIKVTIDGQNSRDMYYGLFTYGEPAGVSRSMQNLKNHPVVSVQSKSSQITVAFNLGNPSNVRCELLTLSGRRAALLYNGAMRQGQRTQRFSINRQTNPVANGVYLLRISVNGTDVLCSRLLAQSSGITGGAQ